MTYPNLRCLEFCQSLEDTAVRSLRWIPTQQLPRGAVVWVENENAYFHFDPVRQRPDDASSVINGLNGGQWVKGFGQACRVRGSSYEENVTIPQATETALGTVSLRSVLEGDHLLMTFSCYANLAIETHLIFRVRIDGGTLLHGNMFQHIVPNEYQIVSINTEITVGESPSDPYVITVNG